MGASAATCLTGALLNDECCAATAAVPLTSHPTIYGTSALVKHRIIPQHVSVEWHNLPSTRYLFRDN